jgi:hypothetical protein
MNETSEYIDRYFNGEMAPDEKGAFESRCLSDPGFAKEVAVYIMMYDQAREQWAQNKKQEFTAFDEGEIQTPVLSLNGVSQEVLSGPAAPIVPLEQQEILQPGPGKLRKLQAWKIMAIAATFLGIVALGVTFFVLGEKDKSSIAVNPTKNEGLKSKAGPDTSVSQQNIPSNAVTKQNPEKQNPSGRGISKTSRDQLVARYFKPDALPKETVGVLESAFEEYKSRDYKSASREYEDAIAMVEELTTRSTGDDSEEEEGKLLLFYARYYNGLSYLASDRPVNAIKELKAIKTSPDRLWQSKVQWYLALATLKSGDIRGSQALLKKVANSPNGKTYKTKAADLLKEIEMHLQTK